MKPYRFGWLLLDEKASRVNESCISSFECKEFIIFGRNLYFYHDSEVRVTYFQSDDAFMLLVGDFYDTKNFDANRDRVGALLFSKINNREDFLDYIDYLNGRYSIIYGLKINPDSLWLMQDATGMRSVFFHRKKKIVATHYQIIDNLFPCKRDDILFQEIERNKYNSDHFPGNLTPFEEVRQLTPNIEFDFYNSSLRRFFPRENIKNLSIEDCVEFIASNMRKQAEMLVKNHPKINISLTAGMDSRVSLAAFFPWKSRINFFTYNKVNLNDPLIDGVVLDNVLASKMAHDLNLNHTKLILDGKKELSYEENKFLTSLHYAKHNPHFMFVAKGVFDDKSLHVRTNLSEIIRFFYSFKTLGNDFDFESLVDVAYCKNSSKNEFVSKSFLDFFNEIEFSRIHNYDPYDMLYWEYRMGTWLAGAPLLESDQIFQTYILFNTRKILIAGLSVVKNFRKKSTLLKYVIEKLAPGLLDYIPNSLDGKRDYYEEYTQSVGANVDGVKCYSGNSSDNNFGKNFFLQKSKKSFSFSYYNDFLRKGDYVCANVPLDTGKVGQKLLQISFYIRTFESIDNFPCFIRFFIDQIIVCEKKLTFTDRLDGLDVLLPSEVVNPCLKIHIEYEGDGNINNRTRDFIFIVQNILLTNFSHNGDFNSISRAKQIFEKLN